MLLDLPQLVLDRVIHRFVVNVVEHGMDLPCSPTFRLGFRESEFIHVERCSCVVSTVNFIHFSLYIAID